MIPTKDVIIKIHSTIIMNTDMLIAVDSFIILLFYVKVSISKMTNG